MPYNTPEKRRAHNKKYRLEHPEARSESERKHYEKHKDVIRKRHVNNYRKYRQAVIEKYGSTCRCCEVTQHHFLTAHHVNRDGSPERKRLNQDQWRWLNLQPIREDICMLCYNCHMAITYYGACPHARLLIGGFFHVQR
jgi:hypothetical protein